MALLKSLIQRLLDSRTTPAQAGHASKPGSAVPVDYNPSASVDNWGPVLSNSTAVSDGYIWATGHTTSDKGFFQINTQALQITTTGTSNPGGEILNLFAPVSKGQLFSVYGRYLEQVTVRLVKTIGGGYLRSIVSAICKRGELCLSRLSLYLPRSSCRTNPNGLAVKQTSQSQHPGLFSKLPTTPHKSIRRLRTAGLRLGAPNLASTLVSQVRFNLSSLIRKAISEFLPLFEKATQSAFTAKQKTSNRSRQGSFQTKAPHNLLSMGGALC